jgi:hypothetical protein
MLNGMTKWHQMQPCDETFFAIEPTAKSARILRLAAPMNRLAFGQMARSSKSYFAKHPLAD